MANSDDENISCVDDDRVSSAFSELVTTRGEEEKGEREGVGVAELSKDEVDIGCVLKIE